MPKFFIRGRSVNKPLGMLTIAFAIFFTTYHLLCYEVKKSTNKIIYAIFKNQFKEPIEVMYLLMNDMTLHSLTSNYEHKIDFSIDSLEKELVRKGYKISDILVMIHGHDKSQYFSPNDIDIWKMFKRKGFIGSYCIYLKRNKAIYEITEEGK